MTHESKYGTEPFEKVLKAEFEVRGLKSMKQAAHLQYRLMLLKPVIRVHIDYPKKVMQVVYSEPNKTTKTLLDEIKPVRATLKSREVVDYDSIVDESFHQ